MKTNFNTKILVIKFKNQNGVYHQGVKIDMFFKVFKMRIIKYIFEQIFVVNDKLIFTMCKKLSLVVPNL